MGSPSPDACDPCLHLRYPDEPNSLYHTSQHVEGGKSGSFAFSHNKENSGYGNNDEDEPYMSRKSDSLSKFSVYLDEIARLRKDLQGAQALAEHRLQMIFELQDEVATKADGHAPPGTEAITAARSDLSHDGPMTSAAQGAPVTAVTAHRHVDPCGAVPEARGSSASAARASRRLAPSLTRLAPPAAAPDPTTTGGDLTSKKENRRKGSGDKDETSASATRMSGSVRGKEPLTGKHAPLLLPRGKAAAPAAAGTTGTKSGLKLLPRAAVKRVPAAAEAPAPSPPSTATVAAAGEPTTSEPRARSTASAARSIKERVQLGKRRLLTRAAADPKKKSDPRDDGGKKSTSAARSDDGNDAEEKGAPLPRRIKKRTPSAQALRTGREAGLTLRSSRAARTPSGCNLSTPIKAPPPAVTSARTRSASDGGPKQPRVASKGAHKREALRPVTNTLYPLSGRGGRPAETTTTINNDANSSTSCASGRLHTLQERYENAQVSLALLRGMVLRGDSALLRVLSRCNNCSAARAGSLLTVALATLRRILVEAQPDLFAPKMVEGSVWQLSSEDLRLLEVAPLPGIVAALREVVVAHDWLRWSNRALFAGRSAQGTTSCYSSSSGSTEPALNSGLETALFEIYVNLHVLLTVAQSFSVVKQLSS